MASAAKINPILAKEVGNDQLLCNICKTTLKKKFWVGHQKGREHKENIIKFKESHANKGVKRHVDDEVVHIEPKKFKVVEEVVEEKMIDGLPAGFFEIAPDSEKKTIESDIIAVKEDDIKKTDDELLQDFYGEIESNEFDQIVLALEEAEANSKVIDDEEAISNVIDNTLQTEQDFETYWNNSKVLEEQKELTQNENMQMSDNEGQEGGESSDDSSVDIDMFRDKTFFNINCHYFNKMNLRLIALCFAFVTSTTALIGFTQSSGVRGKLMCNDKPASGVTVKLFDEDDLPGDLDDLLQSGKTSSNGEFNLAGHTDEATPIDPKLVIFHDCNDGIKPCQRKVTIKIPNRYITKGKVPKQIYDAGSIQLSGKFPGEGRDCIH